MKFIPLFLAILLTGCASATVVQSTNKGVVLRHGNSQPGMDAAFAKAAEECGRYGKTAFMDAQTCRGQCNTQFRCE